jgi:endonuclease I
MKTSKLFLFVLLFVSQIAFSQIPTGYYNSATGLEGTALQQALKYIIDNHTTVSYDGLWSKFSTTDKKANGKVWDMYSDIPGGTAPYEFTFSTDQCGEYGVEGDCYNREHSWPQSWFNKSSPMVSDLFHIYPTDGKVNGYRSDYPYGEVGSASTTTKNGGKLGTCNYPGYSGKVFEPIDDFKGDFARTYFYMATRYYGEDGSWQSNDMVTKSQLKPWALNMMKQWNNADPVSQKEIDRNNKVYGIQKNRNPFIDYPEYVALIWGFPTTVEEIINTGFLIYPNPTNDVLNISMTAFSQKLSINIYNLVGQKVFSKTEQNCQKNIEISLSNLNDGAYFVKIESDNKPAVFQKVILRK